MNYENFKIVRRANRREGENENYIIAHNTDLIAIMFNNCMEAIDCREYNVNKGYWGKYEEDHYSRPSWIYGDDGYNGYKLTRDALSNGQILEKHLVLVDKHLEALYRKHPELLRLKHIQETKKRRRRFNEDDGELDIDRYMSNDPAMWCTATPTPVKGNICRMHFDLPTSAGNSFDNFINSMAFGLAICSIIESGGKTVELTIGYTFQESIADAFLTSIIFKAKNSTDPLDLSRLLSFGLPGLLRKFCIDFMSNIHLGKGYHLGFGQQLEEVPKIVQQLLEADIAFKCGGEWYDNKIAQVVEQVLNYFNITKEQVYE